MAKSATVADLDERLLIPDTLVAGPFGVMDAIAAIREAERGDRSCNGPAPNWPPGSRWSAGFFVPPRPQSGQRPGVPAN
jgi:hypothetical protein